MQQPYKPLIQHKWHKGYIVWNWSAALWEANENAIG